MFRDEEPLSEINIDKYDDLTLKMNTMASETEKGYKTFLKEVICDFVKLKKMSIQASCSDCVELKCETSELQ